VLKYTELNTHTSANNTGTLENNEWIVSVWGFVVVLVVVLVMGL
jgi:hypothetical protein